MIQWALSHIGNDPDRFMLWRARMRFPPIPACVAARYEL